MNRAHFDNNDPKSTSSLLYTHYGPSTAVEVDSRKHRPYPGNHRRPGRTPSRKSSTTDQLDKGLQRLHPPLPRIPPLPNMLSGRAFAQAARASAFRAPIASRTAFRSYADAAASTRPPVELYGVDGTYASALVCRSVDWQELCLLLDVFRG